MSNNGKTKIRSTWLVITIFAVVLVVIAAVSLVPRATLGRVPLIGAVVPGETLCGPQTKHQTGAIEGFDHEAASGDDAIAGVTVGHLPEGLPAGLVSAADTGDLTPGSWVYGYTWVESIASDGDPSIQVLVICGPRADSLDEFYNQTGGDRRLANARAYRDVRGHAAMASGESAGGRTVTWREAGALIQVTVTKDLLHEIDLVIDGITVAGG